MLPLSPTGNMERVSLEIVPPDVRAIARKLHEGGFGVWFVGGALRDFLLGRRPKDWDLATSASPGAVIELFPRVIPLGLRHGTVCVHWNAAEVEVTSIPLGESGGILSDLGRRDFTVNALALAYPDGILLDPHQGLRDLRSKVLRAVGDAGSRFREDPLRIIRACRFVSQYGFRLHGKTFQSLKDEVGGLELVARERIRDEVFKLIEGEEVFGAFELMRHGGVLDKLLPELVGVSGLEGDHRHQRDVTMHTLAVVGTCPPRLTLRLAALFHELGGCSVEEEPACPAHAKASFHVSVAVAIKVLTRWRASGMQVREVAALVANQVPKGIRGWSAGAIRRFIAHWGPASFEDVLELARADRISSENADLLMEELSWFRSRAEAILGSGEALTVRQLAVDGRDVMDVLGLQPGPAVGGMLNQLLGRVLEDPSLNERKILMDFLKKTRL